MYDFFLRFLSCYYSCCLNLPRVAHASFLLFDLFAIALVIHAIILHAPGVCFVLA